MTPIPEGAIAVSSSVGPCPQEDDSKSGLVAHGGVFQHRRLTDEPDLYTFFRYPYVFDPLGSNMSYYFEVLAQDWDQASARLDVVLDLGVGAPLPPWVQDAFVQTCQWDGGTGFDVNTAVLGTELHDFVAHLNGDVIADSQAGFNVSSFSQGGWIALDTHIEDDQFAFSDSEEYVNALEVAIATDLTDTPVRHVYSITVDPEGAD